MKKRRSYVILAFLFCQLIKCNSIAQPLENRNDYLGFPGPGSEPEIFAPGLISTEYAEFAGTFSPDFQEYYFTRRGSFPGGIAQVMVTYKTQDGWTEPERAPFSTDNYEFEPCITPDGLRLYYGSRRSPDGVLPPGQMHQWYLDKINGIWTGPELLGDPFFDIMVMYPSIAQDSTFYFTGMDGIYVSEYQDHAYMKPVRMGPEINFLPMTAHSYIAPDESYLIFDGQIRGEGLSDLFISYRREDGSWCKGKYMGECVNSGQSQAIASVSPDGECLFFTREQDIYWMDASVIDELRLIPAISCSRDSGHVPMNVKFSLDLSTVPVPIEAVEWDLDNDGEVDSYNLDPEFTYLEEGSYTVALKVFSAGDSATWIWEDFISVEDTAGFGMYDKDASKGLHFLYQNFPNPFANETTISYTLSNDAHVRLEVFDILGNKLAKLVDELQRPGSYKLVYNPVQSPSGSLLYRLYTGDQFLIKMMIKK
ncbi:MAG: T9SS type A sorting domain-containing protein [Bacteroidales bacterium]|jgi:hypothetical protein|nr:T9SS type A sorting domain-containing protein [Bacteroidales bacterium]